MQKKEEDREDGKEEKIEKSNVSQESEENKEKQGVADFIYPPTQLGKAIMGVLVEESQESWEEFFGAFYDQELWFGAFIEKDEAGEDVLYPIPSVQDDGTENLIVFEKGSELAAWYQNNPEEDKEGVFMVSKVGVRFLTDVTPVAFEKFDLSISYGRAGGECFVVDKETLQIMKEALENIEIEDES